MSITDDTPRRNIRLIRRHEVEQMTGLRRSSIYEKMSCGTFPTPVKIGLKAVAWIEEDVARWINDRISERGNRRV